MTDTMTFRKPPREEADPTQVLLGFLDYYRSAVERKVIGLSGVELGTSRLPSGWSPLQLLKHLVYVERRWLRWGYLAEHLNHPFGDCRDDDRNQPWQVTPDDNVADLLVALHDGGERTRAIVTGSDLATSAAGGGRFANDDVKPTLVWILTYVLQEYARHTGHVDVARELADGTSGE